MIRLPSLHPICARLRSLFRTTRRLLARWPTPAPAVRLRIPTSLQLGEPPDDRPQGCGWFDSSHELGQGLLVCEHGADSAAQALAAVPLADWLELQLSGWRPAASALAPALRRDA